MQYELKAPIQYTNAMEQVLSTRGISDIQHFLNVTQADEYDSTLLDNMDKGIKMLITHIFNNDKIFVQVDADTDGYTSSALLLNYLNNLFPGSVQNNFSYRLHDEKVHGFFVDTIPQDVKLVICPDSSSNSYEQHQWCAEHGIDVLVLDHHNAEKVSQYACIINNQMCDYPTKSLSGVGIVYKMCERIDKKMNTNYSENYLDLVALGLIADMMDTRDYETQYLIQKGLTQIYNPYIREMCARDARHFGEHVYMNDVAWYIAPYINAVTREGTDEEKLVVFESMLEYKAYEQIPSTKRGCKGQFETRADQAGRTSNNVKTRQNDKTEEALEIIEKIIADKNLLDNKIIAIKLDSKYNISKNLNGLIANKLASKYQRPCLILQNIGDGLWSGSARGYDKSDLKDFRMFLLNSNLVEMAEGHDNAFGVAIKDSNFAKLIEYGNQNLYMINGNVKYEVDFIWNANSIPATDVLAISNYKELWGQKVDEPYVAIENVKLTSSTIHWLGARGKTLRIDIADGINAIKFFITEEEKEALDPEEETWFANIIAKCDKNEWMGNITPQLQLVDYEITRKQKYYF